MDAQFSFGPNRSYFCSAGSAYACGNYMPAGLLRLLEDRNHRQAVDTPYDVAFPMEPDTYAICWKTTGGEDWYEDGCLGPNYARLAAFIRSVATKGGHTSRTVFGPGASYFSSSPSGYSWQNLPPALEDEIHDCMKVRRPTTVALGVQRSYIVLYNDGTVTFNLQGQYPLVDALIRNTAETSRRRGVTYIALNPFVAGEYYAVYGDGSAAWNFPTAWSEDVTSISQKIRPTVIPAAAAGAAPGGTGPPQGVPVQTIQTVQVSPGGTAPAQVVQAVPGGTAPIQAISPATTGGTAATIPPPAYVPQAQVAQGYAVHAPAGHQVAQSRPTPEHAATWPAQQVAQNHPAQAHTEYIAAQNAAQSPPAAAAPQAPAAHKFNWMEGLTLGLEAAEGIAKIVNVLEGSDQQQQQQQQQQ
ncbi:hypothetical protein FB451DRAFT_1182361 [Mycena latifolia]|nr:hypothetical protein FB451DRAFT_1182361 [Mycena latifolia]